jgi:hypothetical protein
MPGNNIRQRKNKVAPISEDAFDQLEKKYNVPKGELRRMATEFRFSRPKLEAHLVVLAYEAKKRG